MDSCAAPGPFTRVSPRDGVLVIFGRDDGDVARGRLLVPLLVLAVGSGVGLVRPSITSDTFSGCALAFRMLNVGVDTVLLRRLLPLFCLEHGILVHGGLLLG